MVNLNIDNEIDHDHSLTFIEKYKKKDNNSSTLSYQSTPKSTVYNNNNINNNDNTGKKNKLKEKRLSSSSFSIDVNIIQGWDGLALAVFYVLFFLFGYLIYYLGATYLNHDCMMAAVPFYFIFVLYELGLNSFYYPMKEAAAKEKGEYKTFSVVSEAGQYNMVDSITSITSGILQTLFDTLVFRHIVGLKPFVYLSENYSIWKFIDLPSFNELVLLPVKTWMSESNSIFLSTWGLKLVEYFSLVSQTILYLFFIDLGYYFFHRTAHENKLFWVFGHESHHSSERYNFSTALRQTFWQPLYTTLFYLFLAPVFKPKTFAYYKQWNTIFQFWVHTTSVRKCHPWIEYIFNTPSHHRVHHDRRVHANYAGMFIIWDRWLGTFIPEESERRYLRSKIEKGSNKNGQNAAKTPRNSLNHYKNQNNFNNENKESKLSDTGSERPTKIHQDEYPIYGTPTPLYSFHPFVVQFNLVSDFSNRIWKDFSSLLREIILLKSISNIQKRMMFLYKSLFLGPGYRPKRIRKSKRGLNTFQAPPLDRKFRYLSYSDFLSTKIYHITLFITIIIQSIVLLMFWEKDYENSQDQDQCNDISVFTVPQELKTLNLTIYQRIKTLVLLNMAIGMLIQGILFDAKYPEYIRALLEPTRLLAFCGTYVYNRVYLLNQFGNQKLRLLPILGAQSILPSTISKMLMYLVSTMDLVLIINLFLVLMMSWDRKVSTKFRFYIRGNERK